MKRALPTIRGLFSSLLLAHAIALAACGGHDDDAAKASPNAGTSGSAGATASRSGAGSSAAGAGDATAGSAGYNSADGTAPCGNTICQPTVIAPACCTAPGTGEPGSGLLEFAGRDAGQCGTDLSAWAPTLTGVCLQLNQPGELDDGCPELPNSMPGQPPFKGCCTEEGFCAGFEPQLPLGCNYPLTGRGPACGPNAR